TDRRRANARTLPRRGRAVRPGRRPHPRRDQPSVPAQPPARRPFQAGRSAARGIPGAARRPRSGSADPPVRVGRHRLPQPAGHGDGRPARRRALSGILERVVRRSGAPHRHRRCRLRPMARLVFFAGHAGTGKTTLARRAVPLMHARTGESFCVLDKDTVYGAYSARVMGLLTGDPDDRDSPTYLEHLRDQEYHGLLDIATENLALGVNVLLVGPFSREVRSKRVFDAAALGVPAGTLISVVWVALDRKSTRL